MNKTFTSDDCPKLTSTLFEVASISKEALFQFNSFFLLLYVQLASPITDNPNFTTLFFIVTMGIVVSKILAGFCWSIASHIIESGKFPYGRYRTMTFVGACLSTLLSILTFFVAPLCGSGTLFIVVFLIFYTLSECLFSVNDIGYWSFVNQMSKNEHRRSKITGYTNLFCALGSFSVTALAPAISAGNAKENMSILIIVITSLYFIMQAAYCYFMCERKEDLTMKTVKKAPVFESLRILFSDRQIFLVVLCYFFLFLSQDLLIGNSANYFYYEYGYGGLGQSGFEGSRMSGGAVSFYFSICFGLGIFISNGVYASIVKHLGKKKLMIASICCIVPCYFFLYFFALSRGNEYFLFVTALIVAFFQGLIFMALTMNVIDSSEYYEAKTGKQRTASIQAAKALAVKSANGFQTGFLYLFLAISPNLLNVNSFVGKCESMNNQGLLEGDIITTVNMYIHTKFDNIEQSLSIYRISMTFLPCLLFVAAVAIAIFCVDVSSEKNYDEYIRIIKERKDADKKQHQA